MAISLDTSIQYLTGVGTKACHAVPEAGHPTVRDLLYYFPRSYIDLTAPCDIAAMPLFEQWRSAGAGGGKVRPTVHPPRYGPCSASRWPTTAAAWSSPFINAKYAVEALKYDTEYIFYGRSGGTLTRREMASPSIYPADLPNALIPVYPLTQGLSSKWSAPTSHRRCSCWARSWTTPSPPLSGRSNTSATCSLPCATSTCPPTERAPRLPRRRLIFEELLMLALSLRSVRDDTPDLLVSSERAERSALDSKLLDQPHRGRSSGPSTRCGRTLPKTRR